MSANTLIAVVVIAALIVIVLDRFVLLRFTASGKSSPRTRPEEKVTEQADWPKRKEGE